MTSVNDIYKFIDIIAPFESAMSFDNVGILAGDGRAPVAKAVVSLDITPGVIKEAVKEGASLIISHHPVIFEPLSDVIQTGSAYIERSWCKQNIIWNSNTYRLGIIHPWKALQ